MSKPDGTVGVPNHAWENAVSMVASLPFVSSKNTAALPAGMVETPPSATAELFESELSSIFQPVRSTVLEPVLVTSNQSAAYAMLLPVGSTSVMATEGVGGGGGGMFP